MAEEKTVLTKTPRNIFKRLGVAGVVGFVVLVALYLFATSGTFVKSFVLPKVSEALNAKVAVSEASVGVLSGSVELKDLLVQADDTSLVSAKSARLQYSFWNLLGGRVRVSELAVDSPVVYVVKRGDGSSNLDPIVEGMQTTEQKEETSGEVDVLLENLSLNNARFRFEMTDTNGVKQVMEAAEVKIEIDRFGNGIDGNLKMSTRLNYEKGTGATPTDLVRATVNAGFKFAFDSKLAPKTVTGTGSLQVGDATGGLADVKGLNGDLQVDLDTSQIKQLGFVFNRNAESLGHISISGPYDAEGQSADLTIEIKDIGKSVLNLAGAPVGIRFGDTMVNSTIRLNLQEGGRTVDVDSALKIAALSLQNEGMTTPAMDLDFGCTARLVQGASSTNLTVSKFQMSGVQGGRQVLLAGIDRPLEIPVGADKKSIPDAGLNLKVTDFDLAPWASLSRGLVNSGVVNLDLSAKVTDSGRLIGLTLNESVRNIGASLGTNSIAGLDTSAKLSLWLTNLVTLKLEMLGVEAAHSGQRFFAFNAAGGGNLLSRNVNIGASVSLDVVRALQLHPIPDVSLSQGMVTFAGRLAQQKANDQVVQSVEGKLTVANLTGNAAGNQLDRFGTEADVKASLTDGAQLRVDNLVAPLSMSGLAAGTIYLNATATADGQNAQANFAATNLNVNLFRPFVQPALKDLQLASIDVNLAATASLNGGNKSAQGQMQLANLVILDPKGGIPGQPIGLTAGFDVNAGADNSVKIPLFQGDVSVANQPGGRFKVNGNLDGASGKGAFKLAVNGINQNLIAPFAGAALGDKRIRSVAIDANATANLDLKGRSDFDAKLTVTNLVVVDPSGAIPPTPLGVGLGAKGGMNGQVIDLENATLALAPTQRADNKLTLSGRVDLSDTNAMTANLKLAANALDLTTYYNLFSQSKSQKPAAPAPPPAAKPNVEPDPLTLPLKNSRIETRIGKIYLREIEITNTVIVAAVDRQSVVVSPLQMAVNGGKIDGSVDLNTSVPGYRYDLRLKVDEVPIQPAVRSFSPTLGSTTRGALVAAVRVTGAGQTGATLQRTLNGGISCYLTNAVIQIPMNNQPSARQRSSPKSLLGAAAGMLTSIGGSFASGTVNFLINKLKIQHLTSSPITHISSVINLGNGQIVVDRVDIRSEKIEVLVNGAIPIAPVLNESPLDLPVTLWLDREGAKHLTLPLQDVGNEKLAKMPELVRVVGTLGAPDKKLNETNLGLLTVAGVVGIGKSLGGDAGKVLKQGGGLLQGLLGGGKKPAPNQGATTNAPAKKSSFPFGINPFK